MTRMIGFLVFSALLATHTEEVEGVFKSMTDSVKSVSAKVELAHISDAIVVEEALNQPISLSEFPDFIRENLLARSGGDTALDPWGERYAIAVADDASYRVYSNGPDRIAHTDDDIVVNCARNAGDSAYRSL